MFERTKKFHLENYSLPFTRFVSIDPREWHRSNWLTLRCYCVYPARRMAEGKGAVYETFPRRKRAVIAHVREIRPMSGCRPIRWTTASQRFAVEKRSDPPPPLFNPTVSPTNFFSFDRWQQSRNFRTISSLLFFFLPLSKREIQILNQGIEEREIKRNKWLARQFEITFQRIFLNRFYQRGDSSIPRQSSP